jgi:phosphoserine phosphatase
MRSERDFDEWVRQRLADWPTMQVLDFERWLRERGLVEFLPAVRRSVHDPPRPERASSHLFST